MSRRGVVQLGELLGFSVWPRRQTTDTPIEFKVGFSLEDYLYPKLLPWLSVFRPHYFCPVLSTNLVAVRRSARRPGYTFCGHRVRCK
jgi:hypothetical protein